MRSIFIIILFLLSTNLIGQFTYFNQRYNEDYFSGGLSVIEDTPGYVIAGVSGEVSGSYVFRRIVLTRIDHEGNQVWWKTYGEDYHDYWAGACRGCIRTSDGGFAISGAINDSIRQLGLLIKFDQNGDSLWSKIYGDTISPGYTATIYYLCTQLADDGYILVGLVYVASDDNDILVTRTDSVGNVLWSRTYGELHWWELGYSIAQLPEGEFLIGVHRNHSGPGYYIDAGLLKIDSLGNLRWIKYYGGSYDDGVARVDLAQDGNYLVGSVYAEVQTNQDYPEHKVWLFKTDTAGNVLWQRKFGGVPFTGWCSTVEELSDESIVLSGSGVFFDSQGSYGWILKTQPDGDSIWMRRYTYYPFQMNYLYNMEHVSDNGLVLTGFVLGEPEWEQSMWVHKLDSNGCDTAGCDPTVGIIQLGPEPENDEIVIYPNPASDRINIRLPEGSNTNHREKKIEFFSVFGIKVKEMEIPPVLEYSINIQDLPGGIYLLNIRENGKLIFAGKLMITR